MALIRADRIKESSTSTGTGAFTLAGADSTYRTFASVCAVADTVYYAIAHRTSNEWEVGLGTYSATNTLTRTTVHSSSNANAAVTFSAGTKDVLLALTKTQLETYASLAGTETLTNKTINASNNTITNVSLTSGVTGTLPLGNGGTGTTTAQLAINALAGTVTSGSYLRGNGTNVVMATIAAGDVPTLNQNTTGTASGSVSGTASYLAKFTGANVVGNSLIYDSGTDIGLGTTTPATYGAGLVIRRGIDASLGLTILNTSFTSAASSTVLVGTAVTGGTYGYLAYKSNYWTGTGLYDTPSTTVLFAGGSAGIHIGSSLGRIKFFSNSISIVRMQIGTDGFVGINETSPAAQFHVTTAAAATKGLIVKGASAQSANLQDWQDSAGTVLFAIRSNGAIQPASLTDSAAANNSIYYSTTASKLVYKDSGGTVNNLY
jgi:hypothetical protein